MCYFVTLIAPTGDQAALSAVMAKHGRAARPVDNPSVAAALQAGEHQYLTTRVHCDCGTVLAPRAGPDELEADLAKEAAKLVRKGWSAAKVARAIEDRRKAAERPDKPGPDSLDLWSAIVADMLGGLGLPRVGLLVHLYSGDVADEQFEVTRCEAPRVPFAEAVATMQPDELLVFTRA